jgi:hypothetical protein
MRGRRLIFQNLDALRPKLKNNGCPRIFIKTFSSLVEATASDLHSFVAQVNNREYGDSRLRAPAKIDYERDIVQVKGGERDFYVLGRIDYLSLRKEQRSRKPRFFKPTPIGFKISEFRKNGIP